MACWGTHTIDNAQILRRDVNRAKGTLTNEEFIAKSSDIPIGAAAWRSI